MARVELVDGRSLVGKIEEVDNWGIALTVRDEDREYFIPFIHHSAIKRVVDLDIASEKYHSRSLF